MHPWQQARLTGFPLTALACGGLLFLSVPGRSMQHAQRTDATPN